MEFTRITTKPDQMGGVPCIPGLRIPIATVVAMVANGMSEQEILAAYPDLEAEDIREALRYAAEAVREEVNDRLEGVEAWAGGTSGAVALRLGERGPLSPAGAGTSALSRLEPGRRHAHQLAMWSTTARMAPSSASP